MTRTYVSLTIVRYDASRRHDGVHFNESRQQACRETHIGACYYAKTPRRNNSDRTRRIHIANLFDASLIYERPLIEKRCYSWRICGSESGVSTTAGKMVLRLLILFPRASLIHDVDFIQATELFAVLARRQFRGEINARFTRCYENRIYVFVNPPHIVVLLLRPFDVIFHSRVAIGNIFTIFCFRRNRV